MGWYVVEGPDDTGKTTLTKGLERRGWHYESASARDRLPLLAQRLAFVQDVENVAWDRCHLGEIVHNQLDRHISTPEGWRRLIEAFLLSRGSTNVLLTQRYQRSDDPYENSRERHDLLRDAFFAARRQSFLYWQQVWPDPMPRGSLSYDEASDGYVEETWSRERVDPEGLGTETPIAWILGQQQNENAIVPWPLATRCGIDLVWPVIDPRTFRVSNSAPSFWRGAALFARNHGSFPRSTAQYQVNAYADLQERWEQLGKPRVIALGKKTVFNCEMADVPVWRELPHPQYWRRFHARESVQYLVWLERALLDAERELLGAIHL